MKVRLVSELVCNKRNVDICVRDAFGKEHVIYPGESREICVLKKDGQTKAKVMTGGRDG
jgi:hypothetical protein